MAVGVNRRRLLLGAATALTAASAAGVGLIQLAEAGVIPGKSAIDRGLGYCDVPAPPPRHAAGPVVRATFASAARERAVDYALAYPPGHPPGSALPVCVLLHGFGTDGAGALATGAYPGHLADAVAAGGPAFALAAPTGGGGYWHPRPGDDPLRMVLDEFLPLLDAHGLRVDRPAVLGYSMGGFGALLCGLTAGGRFASVVANSPAFWRSYAEARHVNPGAFVSASDWDRYGDVLGRAPEIGRLPLRIAIGSSDSFAPAVKALRDRLPDPAVVTISKGCHDGTYWSSQAPTDLRLIGLALGA